MPHYKITYFDARGLAEVMRQILSYAGEPFEDVRLQPGEWTPEKKTELGLEWEQIPILEIDGVRKAQSFAIYRYLARKYKIAGDNEEEEFRCDEIVEATRDYILKMMPVYVAGRANDVPKLEEARKTFVEVDTPVYLKRFEKLLETKGNTWLVGSRLSYADLVLVHFITGFEISQEVKLTTQFPAVQKLITAVQSEPKIKAWLDKRPVTKN